MRTSVLRARRPEPPSRLFAGFVRAWLRDDMASVGAATPLRERDAWLAESLRASRQQERQASRNTSLAEPSTADRFM